MLSILVVEDDRDVREVVASALRHDGHSVVAVGDGALAFERLSASVFDLVVTDMRLPKGDGLSVFRQARRIAPSTEVILMTSFSNVADAVSALKEGAADYLTKPFDAEELAIRVRGIGTRRALQRELMAARVELARASNADIVGASPPMVRFLDRLATVADSPAPILVTGESGTGKELAARRIHFLSERSAGPFVVINCAAFPESLLEAELFGHERGAFTGAAKKRDGRFKAADNGTLVLDEIAEMPLAAQAKLLRVLQEGVVEPLGTNLQVRVNVRVISATHRDLKRRIVDGSFREDLYYRLKGVDLHIPPLRERRGDLPLLLNHFLVKYTRPGELTPEVSLEAWQALSMYPFPGNVRELGHAVQHAVILARGGRIGTEHLPDDVTKVTQNPSGSRPISPLGAALKEYERAHLLNALAVTGGKRTLAAELLGISRKTLWEKLRGHDLSDSDVED